MSKETEIVRFEKIGLYSGRIWFNPNVIVLINSNVRDFRGTKMILDCSDYEPLNIYEALGELQDVLAESSKGAVILLIDGREYGYLEIAVNPTIPTRKSAEILLGEAAREVMKILRSYAI